MGGGGGLANSDFSLAQSEMDILDITGCGNTSPHPVISNPSISVLLKTVI